MKKLWTLLLLTLATSSCADPTRVLTNKPKSEEQKQKEKDQRRRKDKAATEALKNFRTTDQTRKKTKETNQQGTTQEAQRTFKLGLQRTANNSPSRPEIEGSHRGSLP